MSTNKWERIHRSTLLDSPYMIVWQDSVRLPNGLVIDDYSLADLPDGVLVVATDENDNMIMFDEYKYAVDDTVLTFPAGGIDGDESVLEAAKRELLEETGYYSEEVELLSKLYPYPSKINHTDYIVRVKNAKKIADRRLEATESIGEVVLISASELKQLRKSGRINTSYVMAAVSLAFPEIY